MTHLLLHYKPTTLSNEYLANIILFSYETIDNLIIVKINI